MKKAYTILSHLSSLPQFKILKRQECYQKYIKLLRPKWQKAIAFIYIKEETLFIAVTHPGFKMELNYNRDLLKSLLTQLNTYDYSCKMMHASKVVVFHSKYHPIEKKTETPSTVPYYRELASSNFRIQSQDKDLKEKFEQIKVSIQCNK
ncbi:hypothetical protein MNB_SV-3-590 [hydrothermal vent metagenome]|uniref:Zn-ribbon-containing, possibly RNA-binding protein and truncated derivatives n=1 Tax=hydrothermal vent metagenome TaxID=652676 RepID=A0A1W1CVS7_9ZZZZ